MDKLFLAYIMSVTSTHLVTEHKFEGDTTIYSVYCKAQYLLQIDFSSIETSKCDCLLRFTIVMKNVFLNINLFQPQIVLNLFLFFRRFEPLCSY